MLQKTIIAAILLAGGYLIYRQYQKRNQVVVKSGSMEYIIEKQQ